MGYALRYRGRIAVMILLSVVVGASLSSVIFTAGTAVNVLFSKDDAFVQQSETLQQRAGAFAATLDRYVGWAPENLSERVGNFLDRMREDRQHALYLIAGAVVVFTLLGSAARYLLEYYAISIGVNVSVQLNREMFTNLVNLSHRFFDKRSAGEIVARFTNDSFMVNRGLVDVFTRIVREPIRILFCLALAMSINLFLTLIVLLVVSPLVFVVMAIAKGVKNAVYQSLNRVADMASILTETVKGMAVVKAFRMEDYERRRMNVELDGMRKHMKRLARAESAVGPATEAVLVLGIGSFLILSQGQIASGSLTGGELVILFGALGAMLDPLRKLSRVMNMVQISATSASRVFEFIDYRSEIIEKPDAVDLPPLQHAIRFENVHFRYAGDQDVLHGVSFDIKRGETVALVGFSGSGKSTIAKLLPRFYDPTEGCITFDDVDIRDATLKSLRDQIGVVTQETILFSETIRANIAYGHGEHDDGRLRAAAIAANAAGFIEEAPEGYDAMLSEAGGNLSGGQRQRLAIARAIFKDPPILILDEATSSLDSESEKAILDAMDRFVHGRTTLVIAHRLSTILQADKVVVLDGGHVVEHGTHQELMARDGIYRRLYRLQFADQSSAAKQAEAGPA